MSDTVLLVRGFSHTGPDPGTRKLVLVGAYPVIGGFAQLNLDQLAGKGKTSSNPMYIVPGEHCSYPPALLLNALILQ